MTERSRAPADEFVMFRAAKDAMASEAARRYANNLIARYGKVQELKIDSAEKTIRAVCQLDGESEPVTVEVQRYDIQTADGKKFLRVGDCRCSRPWIENLLNDYGRGREVELPGWAASAL